MFNNVTVSSPLANGSMRFCSWATEDVTTASFYAVTLTTTIIIAIFSPVAVIGNALTMAAIWKNPSLRTPSYILLCGLAFTDLCTGLVTQPFHVTAEMICLENTQVVKKQLILLRSSRVIMEGSASYFSTLTIILITLMSIERWLHMTNRSLLTVRRTCNIVIVAFLLVIPFAVFRLLNFLNGNSDTFYYITGFVIFLVCLPVTSIAYFKVYRIIRHHQQQINESEPPQNFGRPAINLAKYKKSVISVLYILVVFYMSYVPSVIMVGFFLFSYHQSVLPLMYRIFFMLWLLSSSLNPLIYIWRMNDIRNGVTQLLKQLLCKNN